MSIQTFLKSRNSSSKRRGLTRRRPTRRSLSATRLRFEPLEERRLLSFSLPAEYGIGLSPADVVAADFSGDGRLDLASANGGNGTVSVLRGNGDGTFQAPQSISLPGQFPPGYSESAPLAQSPRSVAAGDIDRDGKLDLIVASNTFFRVSNGCGYYGCYYSDQSDGYVNVLLGKGSGGFGAADAHYLGTNSLPAAVTVGDLDDDGQPDVITANGNDLSVLLGDGTGALDDPLNSGSGQGLRSISLGDLDGDGNLDTLLSGGTVLVVQKGDGLGHFAPLSPVSTGYTITSAVMGDVNADGKLDLVAVAPLNSFTCTTGGYYGCYDGYNTATRLVTVLLGHGQGSFALPHSMSLGTRLGVSSLPNVALNDLTGDGLPELATIDTSTSTALVAINNGDWEVPATILISDATVSEGNGAAVNAVFTVTLVGEHDGNLSVDYSTADSAAVAGADYVATAGSLTFGLGVSSQTISVPVSGDTIDESEEQFFVNLSNPVHGEIGDSQGTGTIEDDDLPPLVTIDDVSQNEGNRDFTPFEFTVSLSTASGKWLYVNFGTAAGTATGVNGDPDANSDYFESRGQVYFEPGQTALTVTVAVFGDRRSEANETFVVNLDDTDGTMSDNQGVGTIVNDDSGGGGGGGGGGDPSQPIRIHIGNASVVEGNNGTKLMVFTVTLSEPSDKTVRVRYATKNGTAKVSGKDYVATSGQLRFAAGETTKTISVVIKGDRKKERNENFYIDLSDADNAHITDRRGRGIILNDDRR